MAPRTRAATAARRVRARTTTATTPTTRCSAVAVHGGGSTTRSHGGGGGGGGYHGGGGGAASSAGYSPGGGGAGGSNYIGGLTNVKSQQPGHRRYRQRLDQHRVGRTRRPKNQPPTPPSEVQLNGVDGQRRDAHQDHRPRHTSPRSSTTRTTATRSGWWSAGRPAEVFANYKQNCLRRREAVHEAREASQSPRSPGSPRTPGTGCGSTARTTTVCISTNYSGFSFWTNQVFASRPPDPERRTVRGHHPVRRLRHLRLAVQRPRPGRQAVRVPAAVPDHRHLLVTAPSDWTILDKPNTADNLAPVAGPPSASRNQWVFDPGTFKGNQFYEWQVRTKDLQGLWSEWSLTSKFFSASTTSPPICPQSTR